MKKVLKIVGIVLLLLIVLVMLAVLYLGKRPAVPKNYTSTVQTGGELEAAFLQMGPHQVSFLERQGVHDFKKYELYYPADMTDSTEVYPAVIFSNGTGVPASKYPAVLEHLASWGFIVIATEEKNSWNGFSSEMCLRFLEKVNGAETVDGWETNPFYGRVDLEHIGAAGHSQGGVGVINAATENKNGGKIKAIFAASPTNEELSSALEWDYNPSLISVPIFLVSGTGNADETLVVSGTQLAQIFQHIPDTVTKVMARRRDADHGDMLYFADGYMTAWFLWQLKGNTQAAQVFTGTAPELLNNSFYQDQQIYIP